MNNFGFLFLICSVIIASTSQILLKKSANKTYSSFWKEYLNRYVIIGYSMLFASMLLTIMAFRYVDYKNGPVFESLGYVFVMILSYFFFKEKITKKKVLGMALILMGMFVFHM